jgi:DNA polymerase (family 10)
VPRLPADAAAPAGPDRIAVAAALREIGELLALQGDNVFRARTYGRAARALEEYGGDFAALLAADRLTDLPNVGAGVERVIVELARSGTSTLLQRLRGEFPPAVVDLARAVTLPQARRLHAQLGLDSLEALRQAAAAGRLAQLKGFGPATVRRILARIAAAETKRERILLPEALRQVEDLAAHLRRHPAVRAVETAGALRRRVETIEQLDLVVVSDAADAVAAHAREFPRALAATTQAHGLRLRQAGGIEAHLHLAAPAELAPALVDATGAPAHVARLRAHAAAQGLTLEPRRLAAQARALQVRDEPALYRRLGLAYVPPELREDAGEIAAAADGTLPDELIRLADLQGVIHCHTAESDGADTLEAMARGAEALGLRYLTVTDHSATAAYAGGLDVDRLRRQRDEVARVQARVGIRLLHGTESDILRDGGLDFPDRVLAELDIIIASVHNRYRLDAEQMTRRVVAAMRHPLFKIWGHALGRYVLSRPPFACDVERILDAVAESRAAIEINGDPHRLDLPPEWIRAARRRGIRFVVSADAHSVHAMRNLRWGVDMARRGWVRRGEVLNTLPPDQFAAAVRP